MYWYVFEYPFPFIKNELIFLGFFSLSLQILDHGNV